MQEKRENKKNQTYTIFKFDTKFIAAVEEANLFQVEERWWLVIGATVHVYNDKSQLKSTVNATVKSE